MTSQFQHPEEGKADTCADNNHCMLYTTCRTLMAIKETYKSDWTQHLQLTSNIHNRDSRPDHNAWPSIHHSLLNFPISERFVEL